MKRVLMAMAMLAVLPFAGCAASQQKVRTPAAVPAAPVPYPSTYKAFSSRTTLIRNATILTAAGPIIQNGSLLLRDGKVVSVGASVEGPADAQVIDARASG